MITLTRIQPVGASTNARRLARLPRLLFAVSALAAFVNDGARAATFALGPPFGDNMVLQQNIRGLDSASIWGRADKGEKITIDFQGKEVRTSVESDGTWRVELTKVDARLAPSDMVFRNRAKEELARLTNVVVGEVWVLGIPSPSTVEFHPGRLESFTNAIQRGEGQRFRVCALSARATANTTEPLEWHVAQPEDCLPQARRFSNDAAYLARGILLTNGGYVGIIETPRESLATRARAGIALPPVGAIEHGFVETKFVWPSVRDAVDARERYFDAVAGLKRLGLVTNAPPPPRWLAGPQMYSREHLPGLDYAIRGCMW